MTQQRDRGAQNITAVSVIGIILAIIGGILFPIYGELIFGAIAVIGVLMVIGAMIYASIAIGRGHR